MDVNIILQDSSMLNELCMSCIMIVQNTYNNIKQTVPYKDIKVAPSAILMADKASFYGCRFISVQDTLADLLGRHYFHKCYIEGAVDFIWGRGQSIYQVISYILSIKGCGLSIGML